jgi:hypothetical protein
MLRGAFPYFTFESNYLKVQTEMSNIFSSVSRFYALAPCFERLNSDKIEVLSRHVGRLDVLCD